MQQSHLPPRLPQSNSLITPSASPPPQHGSVQQQYNRPTMSAPPLKRQRVSSTPRRMLHDPSPASSSSRSQPPIDIEKEREASRLRLLSAWDNLTRLVRPLDEDDIVNLRTGKITRDNGVLRNASRINFGNMISPADNEGGDEDSDSGDEGGNETDELDTLTERPLDLDETPQIDFEAAPKVLPPVTPLDPLDSKDLQEFLKAEQQRKDLCGSELETEDEDDDDGGEESQEENDDGTGQHGAQDEEVDAGTQYEDLGPGTADALPGEDVFQAPSSPDDSSDVGIGLSDDELDDWGVDDASFVQPVTKFQEEEEVEAEVVAASDSDSDIEIIEGPYVQSSPIRPTAPKLGQDLAPPKAKSESPQKKTIITQYLTPPLSSSSLNRSASSREPFSKRQVDTHDTELQYEPLRPLPSSKALSNTPRVDLTKVHKCKKPLTMRANSLAGVSSPSSSSHSPSKTHVPKLKPIVLLTPRKPSTSQPHAENSQPLLRVDVKGKQRARSSSPSNEKRRTPTDIRHHSQKPEQSSSIIKHGSQKKSISKRPSDLKSTAGPSNIRDNPSTPGALYKHDDQDQYDSATMNSPRKRKRRSSSVDTRRLGATTYNEPEQREGTSGSEDIPGPSTLKRSSSRRRDMRHSSGSDLEDVASTSERGHLRRTSVSMTRPRAPSHTHQPPYSYSSRNSIPPFGPIPDPRAQFIITQAMQQLSALVTGSWVPPFESATPPTYYPDLRYPNPYTTPTHRHPSRYDPDFSNATQPPDSPDPSPEKSENSRRKSLVRRSRSRGRRVSFHIDHKIAIRDRSSSPVADYDWNSSPTKPPRDRYRKRGTPFSGKEKARETHESSDNSESDADRRSTYVRGQTPGPSWQLGEKEHDKSRSHKSRH